MTAPTTAPPTPTPAPTAGGAGCLPVLLLVVLVVGTGPLVLVPALVVRLVLGRWRDRGLAAVLSGAGAAAVAGLLLWSSYVASWWLVARWLTVELVDWLLVGDGVSWWPWPRVEPGPGAWATLCALALAAGTTYGALRWWTAQAGREADLYDGQDERRKRQRAEELRRRKLTHAAQANPRLRLPLGDERGPFVGRFQHGSLGGGRVELRRRPDDRLWRGPGGAVRIPLGAGSPVQHVTVLGATGLGKTESTLRLCEWALEQGWQVVYVSAKEPPSPAEAAAPRLVWKADELGRGSRVLAPWSSPFDAMRGDLDDVRDKLVSIEEWREDYWQHVANLVLAIALETGAGIDGLPELVESLTPGKLQQDAVNSGDPRVAQIVAALRRDDLAGALVRYASLAVSLRGWIGARGNPGRISGEGAAPAASSREDSSSSWAWEDADLCVAELPTGTRPKAGRALMRVMVRDLGAYLFDPSRRRTVDGKRQRVLLVVEEVGALSADPVVGPEFVNLVERARSADAVCVLTAQDPLGLGEDRVADAILTNAATLTYRQTTAAERVAQLVGTADERVDEASRTYDEHGLGTGGSTRRQYVMAVNPDELRRLGRGEAALVALGRFCTLAAVAADSAYPGRGRAAGRAAGGPGGPVAAAGAPVPTGGPGAGSWSPEPRPADLALAELPRELVELDQAAELESVETYRSRRVELDELDDEKGGAADDW